MGTRLSILEFLGILRRFRPLRHLKLENMSGFRRYSVAPSVVVRAQAGDVDAYETLYRTFSVPVHTLAMRMVSIRALADEIAQETFLEVFEHIDGFNGEGPLWAWIRRIAVNKCLMHLRSSWHRKGEPLGATVLDEWSSAEPVESGIDLECALGALPDIARTVVWLYEVEGYTHREIGELFGRTESFSKSQLARAYHRLRLLLSPADEVGTCMQASNNC